MKMRPEDAPAIVSHFQQEVASRMPPGIVNTLTIPHLSREELVDPARTAGRYRIPLLNQVAVLGTPPAQARRRSANGAMRNLVKTQDQILAVARSDVQALHSWQATVAAGKAEFESRYQKEYLSTERFRGFDDALVRLLQLLELPGVGKILSGALYIVRTPFRWLGALVGKAIQRPEAAGRPEPAVLKEALTGWTDLLRKEAARQADAHALWAHVSRGYHSGGLAEMTEDRFQQGLRTFQMSLTTEADRAARAIYEELEKSPLVLNSLRGSKFALDVAAIAGTVVAGGIGWQDLILVPLAATVTDKLVEMMGKQFVDAQREATRARQQQLLVRDLSAPLAAFLANWPASGGSSFERLQQALKRIPENTRLLADLLARAPG
jgi:hypothetical protein